MESKNNQELQSKVDEALESRKIENQEKELKSVEDLVDNFIKEQSNVAVQLNLNSIKPQLIKLIQDARWEGAAPWIEKVEEQAYAMNQIKINISKESQKEIFQYVWVCRRIYEFLENNNIEEAVKFIKSTTQVANFTEKDVQQLAALINQ